MAGQEKLRDYNQITLFEKAQKTMLNQADLFFMQENFAIQNGYNENLFMHAYLYQEALDSNDCELIKWIDKKIRGKLENTKTRKKEDLITQYTDNDIHIHNHYYNADVWDLVEW